MCANVTKILRGLFFLCSQWLLFQVRTKLTSLDGIVPPTHGFMIGSSGMKNVWLSMEHQAILWCNQLVVQVANTINIWRFFSIPSFSSFSNIVIEANMFLQISHTLLSMINPKTGQPFSSTQERLLVLTKMLQSGIPQSLNWLRHAQPFWASRDIPIKDTRGPAGKFVWPLTFSTYVNQLGYY